MAHVSQPFFLGGRQLVIFRFDFRELDSARLCVPQDQVWHAVVPELVLLGIVLQNGRELLASKQRGYLLQLLERQSGRIPIYEIVELVHVGVPKGGNLVSYLLW